MKPENPTSPAKPAAEPYDFSLVTGEPQSMTFSASSFSWLLRAGHRAAFEVFSFRSRLGLAGFGLLVCLAYFLGARLGFALTFGPHPVSTLWPPNAILLAALLLAPGRFWWVVPLAAFPAHLAVEWQSGVPLPMILCWFVSNLSEALIGAVGIRRFIDGPLRFNRYRYVVIFIGCAVFLAPFASSFLDAGFVKLLGWGEDGYWQIWRMRTFSNALTALTVAPVIVMSVADGARHLRQMTWRRFLEGTLLAIGLVAVGVIAFEAGSAQPSAVPALLYAPLPFLLWAALRFGPVGVSASLLATALLVIWGTMHDLGPFTQSTVAENVSSLQVFLIVMSAPLMILAAVIQERQDTEQALRQSEERVQAMADQARNLAGRLIHAQEEERRRIARDLHDDFNQRLAALAITLSHLKAQPPDTMEDLLQELGQISETVILLCNELRLFSHELHPAVLEHAGLAAALCSFVDQFSALTGIRVELQVDREVATPPLESSLGLYRVVQESLRNIARHSGARMAWVNLSSHDGRWILKITDDGAGFDPAETRVHGGLGLISMEERIKLLNGTLEIQSSRYAGTRVIACLPARELTHEKNTPVVSG